MEMAAAAASSKEDVYILGGAYPVSIKDLVTIAAEVLNVATPRLYLPAVLGRLAAAGAEALFLPLKRQPPFSQRSVDFFTKNNAYDTTKARCELGFEATTSLYDGLARTARQLGLASGG
jgi:nucleoside-diphosphate-sugar epimerase